MSTEEQKNEENFDDARIEREEIAHSEKAKSILEKVHAKSKGTISIPFSVPAPGYPSIIAPTQSLQDPDKSYKMFYAIQQIIIAAIPDKDVRGPILDLKTFYLNRGIIGGSDSRQSYRVHYGDILDVLDRWVTSGANPIDLYNDLVVLNQNAGYTIPDKLLLK